MPKKKVEKVHINVTIDEDLNRWLEKTAAEFRMNKSQLINNLISMGKDDVALLKATGVLGLARAARNLKEEVPKIEFNSGVHPVTDMGMISFSSLPSSMSSAISNS